MTNNISLKSSGPWYTIEANDHDDAVSKLLALLGDQAPTNPVPLPTLIGYAQVWYEAQLNIGLSGIAQGTAQPAPTPPPAQQAQPAPWDQEPPAQHWEQPAQQQAPAPTFAPPAQAPAQSAPPSGDIPGVRIWTGPNPAKPQYEATFYQVPFIADKGARDAFNAALKNGAWAKPFDTDAKPWIYIAPKGGTEQLVRDTIAQYAGSFER